MTQVMAEVAEKITVQCHVPDMEVDEGGIKNYYWPISNQERRGFADYLAKSYADIIREGNKDGSDDMLPYCFMGTRFLVPVIALFQGDLLRERCLKDNVDLKVPEDWQYWPDLMHERMPQEPAFLGLIQRGPEDASYRKKIFKISALKRLKKLLNFKKGGLQVSGLKVKPITKEVLEKSVIATQRSALIVAHAEQVEREVVFCRSNRWFKSISDEELKDSIALNNKIFEKKIIKAIADGYSQYGIELKPHSVMFIQNILDKGPALMRVHYNRLLEKPDALPKEIWTGTTGYYWDTMLRVAVMKDGGVGKGHDHGSGCAYVKYPLRGISEFWGCNEFVTFNKNHAEEMAMDAQNYPRYDDKFPVLSSVTPTGDIKEIRESYKKPKTVFIMATLFDNDRGRPGPGNVNNFLVDWQVRLASFLKQCGYDVVIKIHPETKIMPPRFLEEDLGVRVTKEPFTEIMQQADVILFDCIFTTAFTDSMATNIPAVLIDIFDFPWTERGGKLINERCEIVKADYVDNRAKPNWGEIDKAIQAAPLKCENHEFYKTYFL